MLPFDGEITLINGLNLRKDCFAYRKKINYGEAEPQYPEYLTGMDLIKFVAGAKNAGKAQVDELITAMEVNSFCHLPVGGYSSGMLKKISLVLAFLGEPLLILLDEPLTTIDNKTKMALLALINKYYIVHKTGFIISSHQLFEQTEITFHSIYVINDKALNLLLPASI